MTSSSAVRKVCEQLQGAEHALERDWPRDGELGRRRAAAVASIARARATVAGMAPKERPLWRTILVRYVLPAAGAYLAGGAGPNIL